VLAGGNHGFSDDDSPQMNGMRVDAKLDPIGGIGLSVVRWGRSAWCHGGGRGAESARPGDRFGENPCDKSRAEFPDTRSH
jgi:hypothetical protein